MMTLDAHQHFWYFDKEKHSWINDEMAVIRRNFLPEDLQKVYLKNNVNGCVAVQADQSEAETDFLLTLAEEYAFIKGVVGWVDLQAPDLEEKLDSYKAVDKLVGFRHVVQDEPDVKFMLRDRFQEGISKLEKFGYTYDILIFPTQMEAALETIKNFPNQKFVIDHLAKPYIKAGKTDGWENFMHEAAAAPNVCCKVSGMVTEADWKEWTYADFEHWLKVVFDAFGNDRVMFGSDWPVCLLAADYGQVKGIIEQFTEGFLTEDAEKIWGLNAARFYGLPYEDEEFANSLLPFSGGLHLSDS